MNNKDHRSVISRLDDIENLIRNKETISDKIGESFDEYLKTAKVFLYESDIRKFNTYKKKQINFTLILLLVCIIITMIGVIFSIKNKNFTLDVIICYSSLILIPITNLLIISKQKHKRIANSKWGKNKYEFYIHENRLKCESKKGELFILSTIFIFVLLIIFFVYSIKNVGIIFGVVNMISFSPIVALLTSCVLLESRYSYFIFEKSDSYVITN